MAAPGTATELCQDWLDVVPETPIHRLLHARNGNFGHSGLSTHLDTKTRGSITDRQRDTLFNCHHPRIAGHENDAVRHLADEAVVRNSFHQHTLAGRGA